jgi:mono/diheme cytochrome c family protein
VQEPLVKLGTLRFGLGVLALLLAVTRASTSQVGRVQEGKKIFEGKCGTCDGENGSGDTVIAKAVKAADLLSADVNRKTDAALYQQIDKSKGSMPRFGSSLDKEQIKSDRVRAGIGQAAGQQESAVKRQCRLDQP